LVVLILGIAWYVNRPQPPEIEVSVEPVQILRGGTVEIRWKASTGSRVKLVLPDGTAILDNGNPEGSVSYQVEDKEQFTVIAEAKRNGMTARSEPVTVRIAEPEQVPAPVISALSASPTRVKVGASFVLSYKFNEAVVNAMLGPDNVPLDPTLSRVEVQIPADAKIGNATYEVSAKNKLGQAVVKSIQVEVYDEADSAILEFKTSRTSVEPLDNAVTISWHITRAARVELKSSNGDLLEVEPKGEREFVILKKTTYTITAFDDRGRRLTRQVTVNYEEPKPEVPTSTDGGGTGNPPADPPGALSTGGTTGPSTTGSGTTGTTGIR
jgi:hypothetical protein